MTEHTTNEVLRKSLHIVFGFLALTLRWIPWWAAAGIAACAVIGNWLVLHRVVGRSIARHQRGYDAGIVLYPFSVVVLIVVFRERLEYAAVAWALLAFGDGIATLAGRALPIAPLPWNRAKSWGGFAAFLIVGGACALATGAWMSFLNVTAIVVATIAAAIVESLRLGVDDNLTVPFATAVALVLFGSETVIPLGVWPATPYWLAVNGVLAIAGYLTRSVSLSGALGGWVLGTIIILGAGWPLYVALLAFFVIGTAATRIGFARKAREGLAQESGGRRGFSHAFSNAGVAAICAVGVSRASRVEIGPMELMTLAYLMGIASLATAAADTTASEIGPLIGRRAFLPLTLQRVPVGTEGAISLEGTLAGLAGGMLVSVAGVLAFNYGLPRPWGPETGFGAIALLTICAIVGSYLESVAGSWNRKRIEPIPNGVLNFFNTTAGALLMYGAWQITH